MQRRPEHNQISIINSLQDNNENPVIAGYPVLSTYSFEPSSYCTRCFVSQSRDVESFIGLLFRHWVLGNGCWELVKEKNVA